MKNQYRGGEIAIAKKGGAWTVCWFKGGLARKRGGGVFLRGGWDPNAHYVRDWKLKFCLRIPYIFGPAGAKMLVQIGPKMSKKAIFIIATSSNKHLPKMKSTTYFAEITTQKAEKISVWWGRKTRIHLLAHLLTCSLLSFLLWYDFKILVKSRGGGTFWCLALSGNVQQK